MNSTKIYFPNLNGIRFIAAFLVIVYHIEQLKSVKGFDNYWGKLDFVDNIGMLGVVLFFALSGFLITYLLLAEEETFGKIDIRKFYVRRILRIWPLYFLIVVSALLIFPNIEMLVLPDFGKDRIFNGIYLKIFLYAIFLPNLVLSQLDVVPYASHTWSVGTEEQFYLLWPLLLRKFKKHRLRLMFFIVGFYITLRALLLAGFLDFVPFSRNLSKFWLLFNIDCMAIGGIFAILLVNKSKYLKYLRNTTLFYIILGITVCMLILGVHIPFVHFETYALLFGLIILNFASNDTIAINLENKVLNYLGSISYGLYMYHPITIIFSLAICTYFNVVSNWVIYPLTLLLTILLAGLSYRYFEKFFLRYKQRFSKIVSGNEAMPKTDLEQ